MGIRSKRLLGIGYDAAHGRQRRNEEHHFSEASFAHVWWRRKALVAISLPSLLLVALLPVTPAVVLALALALAKLPAATCRGLLQRTL